jgi:hypothetical protein
MHMPAMKMVKYPNSIVSGLRANAYQNRWDGVSVCHIFTLTVGYEPMEAPSIFALFW